MSLTNKDVITAFIEDFKSMHRDDLQPDVVCDFDGDPAPLAQVVKIGDKPTLQFSYRFAESTVSDHCDLFYCLIIAGHELAHWANAHTKHRDKDDLDSKAIEMWADFFGTRLVFTAVARCANIAGIIQRFWTPIMDIEGSDGLLPSYGRALRQVYDRVFVPAGESLGYPSPAERVHICTSGVGSFFHRNFGVLNEGRNRLVMQRVLLEPFKDVLSQFSESVDTQAYEDLASRNIEIHLCLKQGQPLITPGIRPELSHLVGTHYLEHSESLARRDEMRDQVRSWGVDI